ncbi:uncharacterized protein MKZ38_008524 [Zalerion maritima]|uniref:Calcium permeable stress-gated cation channel 1 n=1 Tax=Zalerion maritima TaxID=339359 RepID=A0AAD5RGL6_9PEZI|nr:uncharacterized protein MKZ38_008524 [Zalerion maritima]
MIEPPDFPLAAGLTQPLPTNPTVSLPNPTSSSTCVPQYCRPEEYLRPGGKNTEVQLVISGVLGITAFTVFCILRPRWKSLYQARKRSLDPKINVPSLPDSFLGWIPVLYKVTDEQVLASSGLDAYVFLKFFKVSIRLFAVMLFFAATVLWPVNNHYWKDYDVPQNHDGDGTCPDDPDDGSGDITTSSLAAGYGYMYPIEQLVMEGGKKGHEIKDKSFLWSYLVFTWFFSFLVIYYLNSETFRVNKVRQEYLGSQTTVTDRTFRLTGIPKDLRDERKLKKLVEKLEIGQVENVSLCYDWKELDFLVERRREVLQKLEEQWAGYLNQKPKERTQSTRRQRQQGGEGQGLLDGAGEESSSSNADEEAGENGRLLPGNLSPDIDRPRPQVRIWYGFLYLQSRWTDAIDYYEEKLHALDEKVAKARKKKYIPADLAFVTMDSTAACQMGIQALLCPSPGELLTKAAPAPADVLWKNTYKSRLARRLRGWSITILVSILSVLWLIPVASFASLVSICTIRQLFPEFSRRLEGHSITTALIQTGLPTIVVSLLNVAVPYLYEWLSYRQAQISVGDVELSIVSKNFFFTFFNIFLVFAVSGTATGFWGILKDVAKDTTRLPPLLAKQIIGLNSFYLNFIMLQGIGLFPFKLLDFGNAVMRPILSYYAKTPRDHAEIRKPSVFSYGFYLPTALLVFILCLVYSVLPMGYLVLSLGLVYFVLGYFVYKYQLLYAMDQPQHATGGAWRIICYRVILGLVVFQVVMTGILALLGSYEQSVLVFPLLLFTVWYSFYWKRRFEPLTMFIALKSVRYDEAAVYEEYGDDDGSDRGRDPEPREIFRRGSTVDEDREKGARFVNPNLVSRYVNSPQAPTLASSSIPLDVAADLYVLALERPWIYKDPPPLHPTASSQEESDNDEGQQSVRPVDDARAGAEDSSAGSEFSLGDTHIWRQTTGDMV